MRGVGRGQGERVRVEQSGWRAIQASNVLEATRCGKRPGAGAAPSSGARRRIELTLGRLGVNTPRAKMRALTRPAKSSVTTLQRWSGAG